MVFSASMMWRATDVLHRKNNQVVPGILLLLAGSLIAYRHAVTEVKENQHDHLKTFLGLIAIQMLPLVILEMKIMSCDDPVGLFCKFGGPVTFMHAIFVFLRVCNPTFFGHQWLNMGTLLGALFTLNKGLGQELNLRTIFVGYNAVWRLTGLAFLAACVTELASFQGKLGQPHAWDHFKLMAISTGTQYVEIMAFVPAVWMVCRAGQDSPRAQVDSQDMKKKATAFFLFLVSFYLWEDLIQAYEASVISGLAAAAHILHFLLLVDFTFYVLAHVYNPDKLVGELQKWLPADLRCAV